MKQTAKIRLHDFQTFGKLTNIKNKARVVPPTREFVENLLSDNKEIEFWWYVDQILLDLAGQELTWSEIVEHYRAQHPDVAKHVLSKT